MLPAAPFGFAAGAMFGAVVGGLTVWLTGAVGAAVAFLLGRRFGRDRARALAARNARFRCLDEVIAENDWKVIALLRVSHGFPFGMVNYFCGATAARFWPYFIASAVAMLPGNLLAAYLGSAGRAGVAAMLQSGAEGRSRLEWVSLAFGLTATLLFVGYMYRLMHGKLCGDAGRRDLRAAGGDAPTA